MQSPETRPSLILRLHNRQDVQAWSEFAEIYEPLVYRMARQIGMQDADALEAKQEVMLHLAKVVESWRPTEQGSFRGWLYRVARNVMLRELEKRSPIVATGDSREHQRLGQIASECESSTVFDIEFQRQVFAWAAARVREAVGPTTWRAFWLTYVEQEPVRTVAEQLGVTVGTVYVSRSRVMKRLREAVQRIVDQGRGGVGLGLTCPGEFSARKESPS